MSPFTFRKRITVIPRVLFLNLSRSGHSWTVRVGPVSWNSRTRARSVDLPGPVNYRSRRRR